MGAFLKALVLIPIALGCLAWECIAQALGKDPLDEMNPRKRDAPGR